MSAESKAILEEILRLLGFQSTIEEHALDEGPLLEVKTDDAGRLIGRKGQTLVALQYLTNRMLFQKDQNAPKVLIDVAGMVAGVMKMPWYQFLFWCFLGKVPKCLLIAYGGMAIMRYLP